MIIIVAAVFEFTYCMLSADSYRATCFTWIFLLHMDLCCFLRISLGDKCYYYVHFADEETKAQKSVIQWGAMLGFEPKALFSPLPWFYHVQRRWGAITGEGELMHSFWLCWLGGAHETSRRIDEFGDWGRSNSKEKEFVLGNYILRFAYSEHQSFDLPCGISREEF